MTFNLMYNITDTFTSIRVHFSIYSGLILFQMTFYGLKEGKTTDFSTSTHCQFRNGLFELFAFYNKLHFSVLSTKTFSEVPIRLFVTLANI